MNKKDILTEQIFAMRDFLYHYSSFRVLYQNFDSLSNRSSTDFWLYTLNSHYFQAINLWCMVFGADRNEIHWKKIEPDLKLKSLIISELSLNEQDYKNYWDEIIAWRNQFSAHRVPGLNSDVPDLKIARSVVHLYIKWINEHSEVFIDLPLEKYENEFHEKAEETIKVFLTQEHV